MSTNNDGGPAFPLPFILDPTRGQAGGMYVDAADAGVPTGLSLRDYFAAHAGDPPLSYMQRACNIDDPGSVGSLEYCGKVADWRYAMADAMLAERAKKEAGNG